MNDGIVTGLAVIGCVSGFLLNRAYTKKYGEQAIQWGPFVLQLLVSGGALVRLPENGVSYRFVFWLAALAAVYAFGLRECRKHAVKQQAAPGDVLSAMVAQAVLPLCVLLALFLVAGMGVFGFLWAH